MLVHFFQRLIDKLFRHNDFFLIFFKGKFNQHQRRESADAINGGIRKQMLSVEKIIERGAGFFFFFPFFSFIFSSVSSFSKKLSKPFFDFSFSIKASAAFFIFPVCFSLMGIDKYSFFMTCSLSIP